MICKLADLTKIVGFVLNQSVSAYSTYTHTIAVGRDDWDLAIVTLWNRNITSNDWKIRRMSARLVLGREYDEGYSQAGEMQEDIVYPSGTSFYYHIINHRYSGFSYATDSKLSNAGYNTSGTIIRIYRGCLSGSDVEVDYQNTSPASAVIRIEGKVKLYKMGLVS